MSEENQYADILPQDPVVLEKLQGCCQEIADAMTRIASERDFIKEAVKNFNEETKVEKKLIRALGKLRYTDGLKKLVNETNDKAEAYRLVFKVKDEDDEE